MLAAPQHAPPTAQDMGVMLQEVLNRLVRTESKLTAFLVAYGLDSSGHPKQ